MRNVCRLFVIGSLLSTALPLPAQDPAPADPTPSPTATPTPPKALTSRDLEVVAAAKKIQDPHPFSRQELGFDLPRYDARKVVQIALEFNPQVLTQEQTVRTRAGEVQSAEGAFDTHVTGRVAPTLKENDRDINIRPVTPQATPPGAPPAPTPTPYPNPLRARNSVVEYEAGIRKKLANGVVVNPRVSFSQTSDRDYLQTFSNENRPTLAFDITIPLAKGGGTLVNKAPEIAARFDLLASTLQLRYITSESIKNTLQAYWSLRAAQEILKLRVESEEIATRLLRVGTSLVEGDELAAAQLPQIIADRDTTLANRIQAESSLIEARQTLATTMGFAASALLLAPLTSDKFPDPPKVENLPDVKTLITTALELRDDLRAVRQTVRSRKVLMDASYLELRPTLDLRLFASYSPFETRTQTNITQGETWQGGAEFRLDWPIENNSALGAYVQSQAAFRSSEIAVSDVERRVVSQVIVALAQLTASATNVKLYAESAYWNKRALDAQEELFALGQGSLTDTITARQRLIEAQVAYVNAQLTHANALVQLRFATGLLFFSDEQGNWIDENVWRQVPFVK